MNAPVWSPDGEALAFTRTDAAKRCEIIVQPYPTGIPRSVGRCWPLNGPHSLDWSPDGRSLIYVDDREGQGLAPRIWQLTLATGATAPLTAPPRGSFGDRMPRFSPDGRRFSFQRAATPDTAQIFVQALKSGRMTQVKHDNSVCFVNWSPDGGSLFLSCAGSGKPELWSYALDGRSEPRRLVLGQRGMFNMSVKGDQVAIEEKVEARNVVRVSAGGDREVTNGQRDDRAAAFSRDGVLAFLSGDRANPSIWLQRPGERAQRFLTVQQRDVGNTVQLYDVGNLTWSLDGKFLTYAASVDGERDVFIVDVASGIVRRLPSPRIQATNAGFTRDGRAVVFYARTKAGAGLWRQEIDDPSKIRLYQSGYWGRRIFEDGEFIFDDNPWPSKGLWRLSDDGRSKTLVDPDFVQGDSFAVVRGYLYRAGAGLDAPVQRRPLGGGAWKTIAHLPGVHTAVDVDPTNGDVVYVRSRSTADIALLKLRRVR
jgi:Tol biopolymer transport system component